MQKNWTYSELPRLDETELVKRIGEYWLMTEDDSTSRLSALSSHRHELAKRIAVLRSQADHAYGEIRTEDGINLDNQANRLAEVLRDNPVEETT